MAKHKTYSWSILSCYGCLSLPIAFMGLPIYVHIPKLYAQNYGISLATIGTILLFTRAIDTIQDPVIGLLSDRYQNSFSRKWQIGIAIPFLAISFYMLFNVPLQEEEFIISWFVFSLIIAYTSFSLMSINYYAIGAELSKDYNEKTLISSYRECFSLLGVLLASALPQLLQNHFGTEKGFEYFSYLFIPILAITSIVMLSNTPKIKAAPVKKIYFTVIFKNRLFRWFIVLSLLNAIAGAIPGTLVLFFAEDVLGAADMSGYFLVVYFAASAISIPFWYKVSENLGKKKTLLISMFLSVTAFIYAYMLERGDIELFFLISFASGFALGADYSITPSMLADVIDSVGDSKNRTALYFSIWSFISKFNLALAAGITLPLLGLAGYEPGNIDNSSEVLGLLSFTYALLPCIIKVLASITLLKSPLDEKIAS